MLILLAFFALSQNMGEQPSLGALQVGTATVNLPGAVFKDSFFVHLKWQSLFFFNQ